LTLSVGSFDPLKAVPEMTYNVFTGTLNPTQSQSQLATTNSQALFRAGRIALLSPDQQRRSINGKFRATEEKPQLKLTPIHYDAPSASDWWGKARHYTLAVPRQ